MQFTSAGHEIDDQTTTAEAQEVATNENLDRFSQVPHVCEVAIRFDNVWKSEFTPKYRDVLGFSPRSNLSGCAMWRDTDSAGQPTADATLVGPGIDKGGDSADLRSGRCTALSDALNVDKNARTKITKIIKQLV